MSLGDEIFDWILRRKRCPFCVEPFPVLKCVGFEAWRCGKCETDFCLDEEGHLEPVFNENNYRYQVNHFPKPDPSSSSGAQSNILCQTCTENQQKIVQLLQSFESSDSSQSEHRKQYDLYASKVENRYPLCATCTYRVSVHLKRCEEDANLMKRRQTASSGGDWINKLKLAEQMKWKQMRRKIFKGIFFWPDFLFQFLLTFKCVLKTQTTFDDELFYSIGLFRFENDSNLSIWLPLKFDFSSLYHVLCFSLFLIQFNGIAFYLSLNTNSSPRVMFEIIPQLFLLISRVFIGNFLFRFDKSPVDLNATLTLAAVGLAIIFKTGSNNAPIYRGFRSNFRFNSINNTENVNNTNDNEILFSKNEPVLKDRRTRVINKGDKSGFASYSEDHHKFHSFANVVSPGTSRPIMPWPEKPLPGRLNSPVTLNFDENVLSNFNTSKAINHYKIRPTKLGSCEDPLDLEPMFSSFSLSDEPRSRRRVIQENIMKPSTSTFEKSKEQIITENGFIKAKPKFPNFSKIAVNPSIIGNVLLTLVLAIFRVYLIKQTSLIAVILALTFGLRGFLWPRLPLKAQLTSLVVAVGRLIWLGSVLNGKIVDQQSFGYLALTLDLVLIILR